MREIALAASMLALATVAAHAQSPQPPRGAKDEAQKACEVTAMTDYIKANLALMERGTPLMSVETTIAERRLEEQYCLRLVRCSIDDPNSLPFQAEFSSCLSDEAMEKYDAVPRTKD